MLIKHVVLIVVKLKSSLLEKKIQYCSANASPKTIDVHTCISVPEKDQKYPEQ